MNKNIELLVNLLKRAAKENCKDCCNCEYYKYGEACDVYLYAEAVFKELNGKQFGNKSGFRKGYQKGYQQGFDDGVKMGKSLFKPKLPEVNENCELGQLNDFVYIPQTNPCLNCDFYKKYIAGGQPFIGDAPCQWCEKQPGKISFVTTATTTPTKINKGDK